MIYSNWMSFIDDNSKITKLAIPGAHNAGSFGMNKMACCQDDDFYTQFKYGIRHFCIRLDTDKNGTLVLCHGISKGVSFESVLYDMRKILNENDSEFFILDLREYYPQKFGPITINYKAEPKKVDALVKEYLKPEKYAFCDFKNIADVTVGDIRKSGKRYIILNENENYAYSRNCKCILPWDKEVFGSLAPDFARKTVELFDKHSTDGFYWFQTQQTPNIGTRIGLSTPRKLDMALRPYFKYIIEQIAVNPERLEKVNIVAGDFMTFDYSKVRDILRLNLIKKCVKKGMEKEYQDGLYEQRRFK